MEKLVVTLENWVIVYRDMDPHTPPEMAKPAFHGEVHGHTRFVDGTEVTTSAIKGRIGECIETESGTVYRLGKVGLEYKDLFPNAKERILNAIPA